jgi:hypothetical protein
MLDYRDAGKGIEKVISDIVVKDVHLMNEKTGVDKRVGTEVKDVHLVAEINHFEWQQTRCSADVSNSCRFGQTG